MYQATEPIVVAARNPRINTKVADIGKWGVFVPTSIINCVILTSLRQNVMNLVSIVIGLNTSPFILI
ncbi:hypothetical protein PL8927_760317 [Planktothrix serta PCC 8927]|uniref:Uncharacterized protein n=1 Tax=Planktothrix serta PCC 8927 TaxID=671068 RepID=A0A7Z9E246_9CYAN|nr:hypothetical protein PL8927_760317 [Planktothrix serta PCC 8927]